MRAKIPAGIDLEDRLLYGLSPARLGYVVALAVLAIWFWRQPMPLPVRLLPALLLVAAGAAVGWMTFEGRHLDRWTEDVVRHLLGRYRVEVCIVRAPRRLGRIEVPALEQSAPEVCSVPAEVMVLVLASADPP